MKRILKSIIVLTMIVTIFMGAFPAATHAADLEIPPPPDTVTVKVQYPTSGGDPSYFPIVTVSGGTSLDGTYNGWCADTDQDIPPNTEYLAHVYSSLETGTFPDGLIDKPENLDLVNWILNNYHVGKGSPSGGTYNLYDIQRTIWVLLENNPDAGDLPYWKQIRVDEILAAASTHEGFVPSIGELIAIILDPGSNVQTIFICFQIKITNGEEPNTKAYISSSPEQVYPGDKVTLTVAEENTGALMLSNPYVYLEPLNITLNRTSFYTSGDNNPDNGKLDVGEMWTWTVPNVPVSAPYTTFTATGHGFVNPADPTSDVTYGTGYEDERATVDVYVKPPPGLATRTPGYWQTHLEATTYVFNNYLGSNINIGWKNITNIEDLMGIFWASPAKNSDRSKRSPLCQAKEIAAFQAVAAFLNSSMPNGTPLPDGVDLAYIQATLSGDDIDDIRALGETLDQYNNSGDRYPLASDVPIGKANPKGARAIANIGFADCP